MTRAEMTRKERLKRAMQIKQLLKERIAIGDDPETIVSDFLADLMHYCDYMKLDYAECERRAYDHHAAEVWGLVETVS